MSTINKTTKWDNPSPSNDPWFDDPENMRLLDEAFKEYEEGMRGREVTLSELREMLGLEKI